VIGKFILTVEFNNPDWDGKSDSEIFSEVKLSDNEYFRIESIKVLRSQPQQGESGNSSPSGQLTSNKSKPSDITPICENCAGVHSCRWVLNSAECRSNYKPV
jgi:hypothetical protein